MYAIETLNLPVVLTRKIEKADAILARRSHLRKNANFRRMTEQYRVPIHTIKANTTSQITQALQQLLGINEIGIALDRQGQLK